jgi:hypothetical protein
MGIGRLIALTAAGICGNDGMVDSAMAAQGDQAAMRRLRRRIIILGLSLTALALLSWLSATLTGEVHVGLWIAVLFVGLLLGFALWTLLYVYTGRV